VLRVDKNPHSEEFRSYLSREITFANKCIQEFVRLTSNDEPCSVWFFLRVHVTCTTLIFLPKDEDERFTHEIQEVTEDIFGVELTFKD